MPMSEAIRKQLVLAKLTQFYRQHCPQKLHVIHEAYQQFQNRLPDLFDELLRRYPRAAPSTFDDLIALLSADGSLNGVGAASADPSTVVADDEMPKAVPLHQLVHVLAEGERLLAASPPRIAADRNFAGTSPSLAAGASSGVGASPDAADRDFERLQLLIEENRALAEEVAVAELQVLDKRFEVLLKRCLREAGLLADAAGSDRFGAAANSMPVDADMPITLQITDGARVFQVPMNGALWKYVSEGPLQAPLPPGMGSGGATNNAAARDSMVCVVQASHLPRPVSATKVVIAMAMRHWSRRIPHTVTELVNGEPRFHASSALWWQWPSAPIAIRGVRAESMFKPQDVAALRSDDAVMSFDRRAGSGGAGELMHPAILDLLEEPATIDRGPESDYWAHFLDQWDLLGHKVDRDYRRVV